MELLYKLLNCKIGSLCLVSVLLAGCGKIPDATVNFNVSKADASSSNLSPTADAGGKISVVASSPVTIFGKGIDLDGYIKRYQWAQLVGPSVTMVDSMSPILAFVAPAVNKIEELVFELTVVDNQDLVGKAWLYVTVTPVVASATPDPVIPPPPPPSNYDPTPSPAPVPEPAPTPVPAPEVPTSQPSPNPAPSPVVQINHAPTISGQATTSVAEAASYIFTPNAADVDTTDILTFSIVNKPSWALFDPITGTLSGSPSFADAGIYASVEISVSDGQVATALPVFSITVMNTNRPPYIAGGSQTIVSLNEHYTFTPTATDPDGDTLFFTIINKPVWTVFDALTGSLSGMPGVGDIGSTSGIVITVTDSYGASASVAAFNLAVCDVCVAPRVLFTDIVAGPTTGGENNNGAYLNIFGVNFGTATDLGRATKVFINDVEVADYKYLGNAKSQPFSKSGMTVQQLSVQVGALGGLLAGASGAIQVKVGGASSNTNLTFMNQPGDMIYVALSGSDTTGDGSFTNPYRYVQNSTRTNPAWSRLGPGDTIIMRGGAWSDLGWDNRFVRIRQDLNPTPPNGSLGNGYVAFQAYPGEDVVIDLSLANGNHKGAFSGPSSVYHANSHYFVFSGFTVHDDDATKPSNVGAGGPFNSQTSGDHWRIVNNEMTVKIGEVSQKAAGICGGFRFASMLGNFIHDIQGITVATAANAEALVNHGMYFDNYTNDLEIAFNHVKNISGGNGMQFYGNLGAACGYPACAIDKLDVHHNVIDNVTGKHGLNLTLSTVGGQVYNNVVMHVKQAGLRLGSYDFSNLNVVHNSFFDVAYAHTRGAVFVDGTVVGMDTVYVENNVVYISPSTPSTDYYNYYNGAGSDSGVNLKNNLWYGKAMATPSKDASGRYGDPKFVSTFVGAEDFRIGVDSAAYKAASTGMYSPTEDALMNPRNGLLDIGAFAVK